MLLLKVFFPRLFLKEKSCIVLRQSLAAALPFSVAPVFTHTTQPCVCTVTHRVAEGAIILSSVQDHFTSTCQPRPWHSDTPFNLKSCSSPS